MPRCRLQNKVGSRPRPPQQASNAPGGKHLAKQDNVRTQPRAATVAVIETRFMRELFHNLSGS